MRAKTAPAGSRACSRSTVSLSSSSPAKWPQVSLISLNWSRSRKKSASWAFRSRARRTARSISSSNVRRLSSPVSGSCVDMKLRSRSIWRSSVTSLKASTAPLVRPWRLTIGDAESRTATGWPSRGCSIRSPGNST